MAFAAAAARTGNDGRRNDVDALVSVGYPAYTGVCTIVGRKPNLGVYAVGPPIPRIALGSIGIPLSMPPGSPDIAGVALGLAAGNAEPTWLNAGAAEAQLCGTESVPSEAARPRPAVT